MNNCHTGRPDTAIGIMSGTSVDGIDAVLVEFPDRGPPTIIDTESAAFPDNLARDIVALCQPGSNEIDRAGHVHVALGERYALIANQLVGRNTETDVHVIGCHGQTVRHRPNTEFPFTLQLGSGAVIAALTRIPTVTDFRSADMARGGQGAPFAPFFHNIAFRKTGVSRAVVNLGGIANVTLLPGEPDAPVTGFDTGPANGLMDAWSARHTGNAFDQNGEWAKSGQLIPSLLAAMLSHPFLARSAPKSTGREEFHIGWLDTLLKEQDTGLAAEDVQRTLLEFTCRSLLDQIPERFSEICVCGGGAQNCFLVQRLASLTDARVYDSEILGLAPERVEAAAFAWMAIATLKRRPSSLPSVTGASETAVLGSISFP